MIRFALALLLTGMPLSALPVSFVWDVPDAEQVELVEGYRLYTRLIGEDGPVAVFGVPPPAGVAVTV